MRLIAYAILVLAWTYAMVNLDTNRFLNSGAGAPAGIIGLALLILGFDFVKEWNRKDGP
jgi:hypothetical protein